MRSASILLLLAACSAGEGEARVAVPGRVGREKSSAWVRAERRLFDGAPPVIPHAPFGAACASCHDEQGVEVPGVGFAPPSPHERTLGLSAISRCTQCHVESGARPAFDDNGFVGLAQDLRHGTRLNPLAPPTIPHRLFMRENCRACHSGPAAREEIRCSHPERSRCLQCHVPQAEGPAFARS